MENQTPPAGHPVNPTPVVTRKPRRPAAERLAESIAKLPIDGFSELAEQLGRNYPKAAELLASELRSYAELPSE